MIRRFRLPWALVLAPLAVLMVLGCGDGTDVSASGVSDGLAFPGSAPSLDDLGGGVLAGFATRDTARLASYRLTETEHNEVVFPELPAGRPEVGYPVDLAWENIQLRNRRSLVRQLPWFDGRDVEYLATECRDETQTFETFSVHTDCWIVFRDAVYGRLEVQLFKDALERGGGWKVFRYYDELPTRAGP